MPRLRSVLLSALLGAALAAPSAHAEVTLHLYGYEGEQVDAVIDWGSPAANLACPRIVKGGRSDDHLCGGGRERPDPDLRDGAAVRAR